MLSPSSITTVVLYHHEIVNVEELCFLTFYDEGAAFPIDILDEERKLSAICF